MVLVTLEAVVPDGGGDAGGLWSVGESKEWERECFNRSAKLSRARIARMIIGSS